MDYWKEFDPEQRVRIYDFTNRAAAGMTEVVRSEEFARMDADAIFHYLCEKMEIVLFPDFLKRYIYEKTHMEMPYEDVPEYIYQETVLGSFEDNKAPFSLTKTKSRRAAVVKNWLTNASVSRNTVFVLGFGLKMPAEDVTVFLTKCIQEEDFDFSDPEETVFWYAFKNDLSYAQARKLLLWYETAVPEELPTKVRESMSESPKAFLASFTNLKKYLTDLKARQTAEKDRSAAEGEFRILYLKCCEIIMSMHNDDALYIDGGDTITVGSVSPSDMEKELCGGIPVNSSGNLEAMSGSSLAALFKYRRMSRQRLSAILNRQRKPDRFDMISLLFYIYAQVEETESPKERCCKFIDHINEILKRCNMYELYPVNPYESFVMMCLLADNPLYAYAEVWEKSYLSVPLLH